MKKNYLGFLIPKIWQNLKHFSVAFYQAQTLKLRGVLSCFNFYVLVSIQMKF